jgi:hypothetical protein
MRPSVKQGMKLLHRTSYLESGDRAMPVEKLDLKKTWESGKTWEQWLAASTDPKLHSEMLRHFAEADVHPATVDYVKNLKRPVHLLAIAEDWCGDVRRNVPALAKLVAQNPEMLRLRLCDKETKPELTVRYLTNGAEAIPIVIFMSEQFVEIGNWGPRPYECKRLIARGKASGKMDAAREKIHEFYTADKHQTTLKEFRDLIDIAAATEV